MIRSIVHVGEDMVGVDEPFTKSSIIESFVRPNFHIIVLSIDGCFLARALTPDGYVWRLMSYQDRRLDDLKPSKLFEKVWVEKIFDEDLPNDLKQAYFLEPDRAWVRGKWKSKEPSIIYQSWFQSGMIYERMPDGEVRILARATKGLEGNKDLKGLWFSVYEPKGYPIKFFGWKEQKLMNRKEMIAQYAGVGNLVELVGLD